MIDPATMSALISAGSSIAGKLIGGGSNNHAGRDQRQAISYANTSAIVDKVKAARDMGISPLYALGAPTISTTSAVGSPSGSSLGETISSMGNDISRAVAAGQTDAERRLQALALEKAGLENEYLRSQILSVNSRTARESAPPFPGAFPEQVTPVTKTPGANIWGFPWESNPNTSDLGNFAENRYGDEGPASWIMGGIGLGSDVWWNSTLRRALEDTGSNAPSAARQIYDYFMK